MPLGAGVPPTTGPSATRQGRESGQDIMLIQLPIERRSAAIHQDDSALRRHVEAGQHMSDGCARRNH